MKNKIYENRLKEIMAKRPVFGMTIYSGCPSLSSFSAMLDSTLRSSTPSTAVGDHRPSGGRPGRPLCRSEPAGPCHKARYD